MVFWERLLSWLCKPEFIEEIIGDLHEYADELKDKLSWKRPIFFWFHVLNFLKPWALKSPLAKQQSNLVMIQHHFKFAFRNLARKRTAAFINLTGLLTGLTAVILISLWVYDELSYNTYHPQYERVAKVLRAQTHLSERSVGTNQPFAMAAELRDNYRDYFENVAMELSWSTEHALAVGTNKFLEEGRFVEANAIDIFGLDMQLGAQSALTDPRSIVLSNTFAETLFGEENPMGKMVQLDGELTLVVSGVYADLPKNSEFQGIHYLINFAQFYKQNAWASANSWRGSNAQIYVKLKEGVNMEEASQAIDKAMLPYVDEETRNNRQPSLSLNPMSRWHLYSNFDDRAGAISAELRFVLFYASIGLLILLLVCINFINLSTSMFVTRAKEVGVRKTMGSNRVQLIGQFLVESLVLITMGFAASVILANVLLPWFNGVIDKEMVMPFGQLGFWILGLSFVVLVAIMAGLYPAVLLSSFHPVKALKGSFVKGHSTASIRKGLVVFQFTVSIALISGTLVVSRQINYASDRPEGYDKERLVVVKTVTEDYQRQYELLSTQLMKTGVVEQVAASGAPVTDNQYSNNGFTWQGKHPDFNPIFNDFYVSPEFGEAIDWNILSGRDFSTALSSEQSAVLINESAAAILGFENPVGEVLTWESRNGKTYHIIGVVQDMVRASPFETIPPSLFFLSEELPYLHLRLAPNIPVDQAFASIESVFDQVLPLEPVEFQFVDQLYSTKFVSEQRVAYLSGFFTVLAIVISGLGLYALALFEAARRTKEIGVRKVLGATVLSLWNLLTKDMVRLILFSSAVAIPIAWYLLENWLTEYEYRVPLEWWMFALAAFGAIIIGLGTVSYQSIKVAFQNPVDSLRSE